MGHAVAACKRVGVIAAAVAIGSCATGPADKSTSVGEFFGECNPLITGGIGAVLGALAGGREHRGQGAAIGAGIGALACVAYNYYTTRTKSAEQVSDEYKKTKGALPAQATVTRFNMNVAPDSPVAAGNAVTVASNIEVVPGTKNPQPTVEQEIVLYSPDGKETGKSRKPASQDGGGGGFETSFRMTLPKGVPQGVYPVKSQLYVDGQPAASADARLQIVVVPAGTATAWIGAGHEP